MVTDYETKINQVWLSAEEKKPKKPEDTPWEGDYENSFGQNYGKPLKTILGEEVISDFEKS